jgi:predicted Co/Zn/Cd cation transporter (cation efflux family)
MKNLKHMKQVMTPFGMMENHSYKPEKKPTRKERQHLNARYAKHTWYLELAIAACLGAALALGFVVAHQMIVTEWAW